MHVVAKEYFHGKHSLTDIRDTLLDLFGDVFFVVPGLVTARNHRGESLKSISSRTQTVRQEVTGSVLFPEDPSQGSFTVRISLVRSWWKNTIAIVVTREHIPLIISVLYFLQFPLWSWLSFKTS